MRLGPRGGHECDDASAEPRAGEPGAVRAFVVRELDETVELGCRHREVVAQRCVAGPHQLAAPGDVAGPQRGRERERPRAFSVTT